MRDGALVEGQGASESRCSSLTLIIDWLMLQLQSLIIWCDVIGLWQTLSSHVIMWESLPGFGSATVTFCLRCINVLTGLQMEP